VTFYNQRGTFVDPVAQLARPRVPVHLLAKLIAPIKIGRCCRTHFAAFNRADSPIVPVIVYGPGVSGDQIYFEDVEAAYRPASTFDAQLNNLLIFSITGDRLAPIPEPATGVMLATAIGLAAWRKSRRTRYVDGGAE